MTTYSNTNRGVLFKETNKKSDTHADYSGNIHIGDDPFWLKGWIREKDGEKYLGLSASQKDDGPNETGEGKLEANASKESDNHPDYRGTITFGSSTMKLAAWKKTSRDGNKQFISISVDAQQSESRQPVASSSAQSQDNFDDDIPF